MIFYDDAGIDPVLDCGGGNVDGYIWTFRNCATLVGDDSGGLGDDLADMIELAGLIAEVAIDS